MPISALPDDVEALKRLVLAREADLADARARQSSSEALIAHLRLTIENAGIEMIAKRIDLLQQLQPHMRHLAVLTPLYLWDSGLMDAVRHVAQKAGLVVTGLGPASPVQDGSYRHAFAEIDRDRPDAILVSETVENYQRASLVVELINAARIPALYPTREYAEAGGVLSYAVDVEGLFVLSGPQVRSNPEPQNCERPRPYDSTDASRPRRRGDRVRRRDFLSVSAGAVTLCPGFSAQSQGSKLALVAFLFPGSADDFGKRRVEALRKGLQEAGFVEGTHYSLETRFAAGYQFRMPELARELQSLKPTVMVITASVSAIRALEPSTAAVFTACSRPSGFQKVW